MKDPQIDNIRQAVPQDLDAIVEIYNFAVQAGFETAETEEASAESKKGWFAQHCNHAYPVFVSIIEGKIVGWISISPYRQGRQAVRFTVEVSYYVHNEYKGRGIGSQLMAYCLEQSRLIGYKTLFAIVIERNATSFRLLEKFGFQEWGRLPAAVDVNGEECDHVYYGLKL